jgi:hypothetical protein
MTRIRLVVEIGNATPPGESRERLQEELFDYLDQRVTELIDEGFTSGSDCTPGGRNAGWSIRFHDEDSTATTPGTS